MIYHVAWYTHYFRESNPFVWEVDEDRNRLLEHLTPRQIERANVITVKADNKDVALSKAKTLARKLYGYKGQ